MSKVPHERTKLGRLLLTMKREVEEWIEKNHHQLSEEEVAEAVWLAWDFYALALNGPDVGRGRHFKRAQEIAAKIKARKATTRR